MLGMQNLRLPVAVSLSLSLAFLRLGSTSAVCAEEVVGRTKEVWQLWLSSGLCSIAVEQIVCSQLPLFMA